ncbi:MAG TPA: phage portal protein [Tepidisphaeraceae bacterium]|jgi:HK97 family phage portal protein
MSLLSKIFGRTETRAAASTTSDFLPSSFGMFGGGSYNDTGVSITEANAVICSAVWACVAIIGQTISTLPIHVIRKSDGTKLYDHPLHRALTIAPNDFMTPAVFREALMTNALLWGGAGAAVARDELGQVEALYPLRSSDVKPTRKLGELIYEARVGSNLYELTPDQIVYILGWSTDGITPLSPVRSGTQAIALDEAMGRYAAKAFGGANIGGILQMPKMNDDAMKSFVNSWRTNYSGIDNAFRVAALPDPMKFVPTSMSPESAQMTEARQNQVLEVARYYKVPPHLLGLLDKGSSFSSIEQQNMFFVQQCITPWCVKFEQELMSKGLLESERADVEVRFNLDGLLRGSTQERYSSYQTGRQGGWLSINDIRRKESLPPIEGGNAYLTPLNMTAVNTPAPVTPATPVTQPPAPAPATSAKDEATRALLLATVKRFVTKEVKATERAAKKYAIQPDELRSWAGVFYADHRKLVADTLAPVLAAAGLTLDPVNVAERHCAGGVTITESAINQKLTAEELVSDIEGRAIELVDLITGTKDKDNELQAA